MQSAISSLVSRVNKVDSSFESLKQTLKGNCSSDNTMTQEGRGKILEHPLKDRRSSYDQMLPNLLFEALIAAASGGIIYATVQISLNDVYISSGLSLVPSLIKTRLDTGDVTLMRETTNHKKTVSDGNHNLASHGKTISYMLDSIDSIEESNQTCTSFDAKRYLIDYGLPIMALCIVAFKQDKVMYMGDSDIGPAVLIAALSFTVQSFYETVRWGVSEAAEERGNVWKIGGNFQTGDYDSTVLQQLYNNKKSRETIISLKKYPSDIEKIIRDTLQKMKNPTREALKNKVVQELIRPQGVEMPIAEDPRNEDPGNNDQNSAKDKQVILPPGIEEQKSTEVVTNVRANLVDENENKSDNEHDKGLNLLAIDPKDVRIKEHSG